MNIKLLIDKINNRQNMIIEVLVMSLITGWFVTNSIYKTYIPVENAGYLADFNKVPMFVIIVLTSIVAAIVYFMDRMTAGIIMFLSVYIYSLFAVYNNPEKIYYAIGLVIISALAAIYAKKDILKVLEKLKLNDKMGIIVVAVLGIILIGFIGTITVLRYKTYSASTFDFGIFAQMFENMKNTGRPITSVERPEMGEFSHFGVHFSPIFYVMLPMYFVFSSPETVQMMQAIVLGLAVIPLYLLCRHYNLSPKMGVLVCAIYCLLPATAAGTYYDFHENCCLPVLLLSLILAVEKKKNIPTIVFALLLVMVKEDAAFYLLVLGVYFLFSKRDKLRGLIMSVSAIVYFAVAMAILHSYGLEDLAAARFGNVMYDYEQGFLSQIVVTTLTNPAYIVAQMMDEEKIKYIFLMILPLGMALVQKKKYSRYILLGTFIVLNIIPDYAYMHDIGFQYNYGTIALMIYIVVMTVSEWKSDRRGTWGITAFVITSILFVGFTFPKYDMYVSRYDEREQIYEKADAAIESVPRNGSVLVSGFMMPHFYDVRDLTVIREGVEVTQDYVVVDLREGYSTDIEVVRAQLEQNYTLINEVEYTLAVYQRNR